MSETSYDVTAIGNAVVDIIGRCDDAFLQKIGAQKGGMALVSAEQIDQIYQQMGPGVESSGGSAANTVAGIASFGGRAGFIAKVADDDFGRVFSHDIKSIGVEFSAKPVAGGDPTSRCLILVTPDGERTMNTYLGISTQFDIEQLNKSLIRDSAVLYLEGYLFDRDDAKAAFQAAFSEAKNNGRKVALTLSDGFCVDRHRASFLEFIRAGVDILFANESEITSLYEANSFDEAADKARNEVPVAVLTRSEKGSTIFENSNAIHVDAESIEKVVDTTGAGDLYAAGFLFGQAKGLPLETCGKLASMAAGEIISHIGARPAKSLQELAIERGLLSA